MKLPSVYSKKLIVSGNVAELYNYELPVVRDRKNNFLGRAGQTTTTEEQKRQNRVKRAQRARQNVRRLVNANFSNKSKFITLTYSDNKTDLKAANRDFTLSIKRFNRFLGHPVKYVAVPEFQKRGAVHYHVIMDCPYIPQKKIAELWGHGFVKINRIDNIDNVGAYLTKYMTKDLDDERLAGVKCYFRSYNLKKPEVTTNYELIDEVLATVDVKRVACSYSFQTDYFGQVSYVQLVFEERITLMEIRKQMKSAAAPPLQKVGLLLGMG